jgi:hypothetical protein
MRPTIFLPFATAALLAACASAVAPARDAIGADASSAQTGSRSDTLSIRIGQSASLDGGRLEIKFESHGPDSRCPANATCVWAGDVAARITTRVAGGAAVISDLHSTLEPTKLKVDRYTLSMVGLTPYPGTGRDAETTVLILRVTSE